MMMMMIARKRMMRGNDETGKCHIARLDSKDLEVIFDHIRVIA